MDRLIIKLCALKVANDYPSIVCVDVFKISVVHDISVIGYNLSGLFMYLLLVLSR